jgi:hypothetical protein
MALEPITDVGVGSRLFLWTSSLACLTFLAATTFAVEETSWDYTSGPRPSLADTVCHVAGLCKRVIANNFSNPLSEYEDLAVHLDHRGKDIRADCNFDLQNQLEEILAEVASL